MMDHDNDGIMEQWNHGKMKKAAPAKAGDLKVSGAWARHELWQSAVNSAGFMTIKNSGLTKTMSCLGARSPISEITELHTHIKDGDVMRMRRVNDGIQIPKGVPALSLKPGGLHVMFIKLKAPLKAGVTIFPVTLIFQTCWRDDHQFDRPENGHAQRYGQNDPWDHEPRK